MSFRFQSVLAVCLLLSLRLWAQQPGAAAIPSASVPDASPPNAPQPLQTAPVTPENESGRQTRRILGVIPNFRSVSAETHLPPQSALEKLTGVAQDSFDYSSFIFVAGLAAVGQLQSSTPEFHHGAPAYARYYWHNFADQTDENLWVGFLLPVALREDARYYTLGRGLSGHHHGALARASYAFTRVLVTRTDHGGSSFNFSEVVGAGAAAGISGLYYPASNRGWTKTGQRWVLNVSIDAATNVFKEFWPDINRGIFHRR